MVANACHSRRVEGGSRAARRLQQIAGLSSTVTAVGTMYSIYLQPAVTTSPH